MMLFLREARIRAAANQLKGQAMSTNGFMQHVYSGFGCSSTEVNDETHESATKLQYFMCFKQNILSHFKQISNRKIQVENNL